MIHFIPRVPCSPTLSSAMDEQITLLEQLYCVINTLNKTIEQVNKNTEIIENIDVNFDELKSEIEALEVKFNYELSELERELITLINNNIAVLKNYSDNKDEYLQEQINNIQIGEININDPSTGLNSPLQVVIDNLYDLYRPNPITASEFDLLELSASEFDSKDLTANDFDLNAKILL